MWKQQLFLNSLWLTGTVSVLVAQPAWAQVTQVTGVKLKPTPSGLEVILDTADGATPQIFTSSSDQTLILDVSNAQLRLPSGNEFRANKPVEGIAEVTAIDLNANSIQVRVTGSAGLPTVEVFESDEEGLIFSLTPAPQTAEVPSAPAPETPEGEGKSVEEAETPEEEPEGEGNPAAEAEGEEQIEVLVTAEGEEGYQVDNATTATRTDTPIRDIPQSIQIVPQQVLEDQQVIRLDEAVRNVSGVAIGESFAGTSDGFIIRGFGPASIFRNGFEVDRDLLFPGAASETANIERVEVLKGPASVLYGNLQPGGIINQVTKQPLPEPYYSPELQVGSYEFYRPTIDFSGPLNPDKTLLYRLNAAYENSESFRDFSQIERFFIAPVLTWNISDNTSVTLELEYLNDERPFDEGLVAVGTEVADIPISRRLGEPDDFRQVEDFGARYLLEHRFSEDWTLRNAFRLLLTDNSTFRFVPRELDETTGDLEREPRSTDGISENYALQTDLVGRFATGSIEHQVLFGVELTRLYQTETVARRRPAEPINIFNPVYGAVPGELIITNDEEIKQDTLGIYLQDRISLADNLKLLVGGQFNLVNQENNDKLEAITSTQQDEAFTPRIGLVYQPIDPISLYASFSQSFEANSGFTADNSPLEPERGTQYEVGVKADLFGGRLSSTLAFFDITKKNVATIDEFDFLTTVGEQRSQGIELDVGGEITPGWNIIASYAYIDAEITQDNDLPIGSQLQNVPEHSASLWTKYEIQNGDLQGLGFGIGLFFVGERLGDYGESFVELPSCIRSDAAIYYRRNNWKAALNIKNLFDVRYFESATERLRINPGEPLTVVGSVSVEF